MSMIRRAVALTEQRGALGSIPFGDTTPIPNSMLGGLGAAGTVVSENSTLQVAAVYGSLQVLCNAVATLPVRLYNGPDPTTRKSIPLVPLLTKPFVEISRIDWMTQFVMSLGLRGNFFGRITQRDPGDLTPTQIKPVHPDHVMVRRIRSGPKKGQIEYRFGAEIIPIDQVFHVKYLSRPEDLAGLNPIEYLRNLFGEARAQDLWQGAFYGNDASPGGYITVPGDLDIDATKKLGRGWRRGHQGINKSRSPAVLTGGAEWKQMTVNPVDAQFLENRQFTAAQISGMIYLIPPHMIGLVDRSTSWGRGIEEQEAGWTRNGLAGYLDRYTEAMTLLLPPNRFVGFDKRHRERGNALERAQTGSLMMLAGAWCADDVRATFDMPPVANGEGQNFFAPINTELLQAALAQVTAMQAAATAGDLPVQQPPPQ